MNQLQKTDGRKDLKALLQSESVRQQIALVLPRHLTPDRMARVAVTTLMRVPKLAQSTPESFLNCLMQCSQLGLEPDGRRAHLIPFENRQKGTVECTLIVDWKGLAELAMRSGMIAKLHADLICDADEFAYDMGDILHHRINFRADRGRPYAAYAMATTKGGEKFVQVMTASEIEAIRDNSQGWRAFKNGYAKQSPWQDSPGEMWKKTVFRRLSKWLPLSPEFRDALDVDDEEQRPPVELSFPAALPDFAPAIEDQKPESPETPEPQPQRKPERVPKPHRPEPARTATETAPENPPLTATEPEPAPEPPAPEPPPAPPAPAPAPPEPRRSAKSKTGVEGLREAMEAADVNETQVLSFFNLAVRNRSTPELTTVEQLPPAAMAALTSNLLKHEDPTNEIVKKIREFPPL